MHSLVIAADRAPTTMPLILIVEDDPDARDIMQVMLELQGFNPSCHPDGKSALAWLADHEPDLVVLDMMLPDINGLEICRTIRKQYSQAALPILMVTALGTNVQDRIRGLEAGANDVMAKPYDMQELEARIGGLLGVKREAERIERLLERYTTRVMRHQARLNPDLLGQRVERHGVILFADLRGFTHLGQQTPPARMMAILDEFFETMLGLIDRNGGTVFELIGDELLAAFNVPYDVPAASLIAVQTALQMHQLFRKLQAEWAGMGMQVGMGIGIHQGNVILGSVGASELMRYTIIGNPVRIAHRLVDFAGDKEIVISDEVYQSGCHLPATVRVERQENIKINGMDTPQILHRIITPD